MERHGSPARNLTPVPFAYYPSNFCPLQLPGQGSQGAEE